MSKCTKCGSEFDYQENLKGYSPVSIYQLEYCQKCLSQAVNVENALNIMNFNKKVENEKKIREKSPSIWEKITTWFKKIY